MDAFEARSNQGLSVATWIPRKSALHTVPSLVLGTGPLPSEQRGMNVPMLIGNPPLGCSIQGGGGITR